MILIAHRGNINGINPDDENKPEYIFDAYCRGYHAEVDTWSINHTFFFGHDGPQYKVPDSWDFYGWYWFHCKNEEALERMYYRRTRYFAHETDHYGIVSDGTIWTCDISTKSTNAIIMMTKGLLKVSLKVKGVCCDVLPKLNYRNERTLFPLDPAGEFDNQRRLDEKIFNKSI